MNLEQCKSVSTFGAEAEKDKPDQDCKAMSPRDASRYREVVARANYLGHDRPDIQYAVNEASKRMSRPRRIDEAKIKILA
eukprot:9011873-Lingulodinium_polyedra.AAC.1